MAAETQIINAAEKVSGFGPEAGALLNGKAEALFQAVSTPIEPFTDTHADWIAAEHMDRKLDRIIDERQRLGKPCATSEK